MIHTEQIVFILMWCFMRFDKCVHPRNQPQSKCRTLHHPSKLSKSSLVPLYDLTPYLLPPPANQQSVSCHRWTVSSSFHINSVIQHRISTHYCQELDSKYFWPCQPYGLCDSSALPWKPSGTQGQSANEWLCSSKTAWRYCGLNFI